jgi:carbonic anhydrase
MKMLQELFENNKNWAENIKKSRPSFFINLSKQQKPKYLWIGCSDSRVPATEIVGLEPGEIFVHRNIANIVVYNDLNCLSVIQYAVDILKVKHIIVCGHYGCGGIISALNNEEHGLIDNWLNHVKDVHRLHQHEMDRLKSDKEKADSLCELNVKEQVTNVCQTSIVQHAWNAGQALSVHGWIYAIEDGRLKDLKVCRTE